jgi:dihydrofolate reductase
MDISIIVAVAQNGAIGKDNQLLWRLSEDLKLFKKRTTNHAIIMGRKTYDSIGKPLPNRQNIVITRNKDLEIEGCLVVNSLQAAVEIAKKVSDKDEVFIIGGEKIYSLAENAATKLYLTKVNTVLDGDAFFNLEPYKNWPVISSISFPKDEKNEYDFEVLEMIKP